MITDNDKAEINALAAVYVLAVLYLCSWHVDQAVVQNLSLCQGTSPSIPKADQRVLLAEFQVIRAVRGER